MTKFDLMNREELIDEVAQRIGSREDARMIVEGFPLKIAELMGMLAHMPEQLRKPSSEFAKSCIEVLINSNFDIGIVNSLIQASRATKQ